MLKEAPPRLIYPSDAEVTRLTSSTNIMAQRLIWFLAQTGMRQEEGCSLQWSQVDLERREVRLYRTKTSTPRIVPLSDDALETLRTTPRHPFGTHVFWHHEGERYRQFSNRFRELAHRVGFTHTCHSLRHKFASEFLQRGSDIASLQAILGHKSIAMTMRYSHIQTDRLHQVIQGLRPKPATEHNTENVPGQG
jgi:integrase